MAQARSAQLSNPFRDLRRAVAANDIVRALTRVGFTQKQIANATGATDRSVRNWATTGAIRPTYDERIRELSEISLLLSETMTARGVTQWLNARNRLLGGERPVDLIARGEADRVRKAAESFVEGAYV
jgi:predicted transcriptional regulator